MASPSARHSSVLPTPVGPRKMKEPIGPFRILQPRSGPAKGPADGADGLVLADHPLVEQFFHVEQPLTLVFRHFFDRDARPARRRSERCSSSVTTSWSRTLALLPRSPLLRHFFVSRPVLRPADRLLFQSPDGQWLLSFSFCNAFSRSSCSFTSGGAVRAVQTDAGGGLVHQVDGLIRQKTVGNISVGQADGGLQRLIGNLDLVVRLIRDPEALSE